MDAKTLTNEIMLLPVWDGLHANAAIDDDDLREIEKQIHELLKGKSIKEEINISSHM